MTVSNSPAAVVVQREFFSPIGPAELAMPASEPSPPADMAPEEDVFDGDQADAQSFIQPAISPIASRLTLPKTLDTDGAASGGRFPEAEHFGRVGQSYMPRSEIYSGASSAVRLQSQAAPRKLTKPQPSGSPDLLHTGPKETAAREPAMSSVFGGTSRHQRSASGGETALRRLSKALPSISLPSGLLPSIQSPSFLSHSLHRDHSPPSPPYPSSPSPESFYESPRPQTDTSAAQPPQPTRQHAATSPVDWRRPDAQRQPSAASRRSLALRRSTSDESMLYNSLSRVSSFGDDGRFVNIREQVNSRLKAFKDSWEGPTFKIPNILKSQPVENPTNLTRDGFAPATQQRASRDGLTSLDAVLASLTGDIVVLGGYRGSVLRSAKPPYRQVWVPVKVGLNIRKVNLEVGLDPEDELNMEKTIFASGMLQNIGPVDMSKRLFKKLRECENARRGKLRVHDFGYDWRLSPHLLSQKLIEFLERLPSNHPRTPHSERGALVIAHSLGGLITRHAVNLRPELFSGVLYAGVPQRCINILGPIRNGDAVLFNEKVLTAQVHFSLRTTFIFLPEDGYCFVDKVTKEEYRVDFYDINDWIKYRWSPCVSGPPAPPTGSHRNSMLGSLLNLSESNPFSLPIRNRSASDAKKSPSIAQNGFADVARALDPVDRAMAPQMDSAAAPHSEQRPSISPQSSPPSDQRARNIAYLTRTLGEIKQFRAELAHNPQHQEANVYPPLAVIYGKETPTVVAARVTSRDAIASADAYDDLQFASGDGVVLAREAMLPDGYELIKGGRVSTERGHVTMLGDLSAVGRALEAIVRGRRKGIGLGGELGNRID